MPRTIPIWQIMDAFDEDDSGPLQPELEDDGIGEEDEYIRDFCIQPREVW